MIISFSCGPHKLLTVPQKAEKKKPISLLYHLEISEAHVRIINIQLIMN